MSQDAKLSEPDIDHRARTAFSQKLAELMAARETWQGELARKLGVTKGVVQGWVSGKHEPNLENLMRLAKLLAVPLTYFAADDQCELAHGFSELDADIWRIVRTIGPDEAYRRLIQAHPTNKADDIEPK